MPVAATLIGDHGVRAVLNIDMATERRGTATLDGRHHLQLVRLTWPVFALRHAARGRGSYRDLQRGRDMAGGRYPSVSLLFPLGLLRGSDSRSSALSMPAIIR